MENIGSVPIWRKHLLTITEASEYFNIGEKKIREILERNPDADYLLMNGKKHLIKRVKFGQMLDDVNII